MRLDAGMFFARCFSTGGGYPRVVGASDGFCIGVRMITIGSQDTKSHLLDPIRLIIYTTYAAIFVGV